jgi:hypothetical protein
MARAINHAINFSPTTEVAAGKGKAVFRGIRNYSASFRFVCQEAGLRLIIIYHTESSGGNKVIRLRPSWFRFLLR